MNHNWDALSEKFMHKPDDETSSGVLENILFLWPPILKNLGDIQGQTILDFGCGTGTFCKKLNEDGATVTGFDTSQAMLSLAKQTLESKPIDLISDLSHTKNKTFDSITSIHTFHTFEFINDIENTITKIANLLKPGGKISFAVHDPSFLSTHAKKNGFYFTKDDGQSYYDFQDVVIPIFTRSIDFYKKLLHDQGFTNISTALPVYTPEFKKQANIADDVKNWAIVFGGIKY